MSAFEIEHAIQNMRRFGSLNLRGMIDCGLMTIIVTGPIIFHIPENQQRVRTHADPSPDDHWKGYYQGNDGFHSVNFGVRLQRPFVAARGKIGSWKLGV